jgi:hypothetical protein
MTNGSDTLSISAASLADFETAGLDLESILEWAYVDDPIARRQRIEVANKLPILVPMLVFDPDNPWTPDLTTQLDSGVPLLECLTDVFPSKGPESVGVLVNKPLGLLGDWSDDVRSLMLAIECLDVDELPETDADWQMFTDYAKALHPCESTLGGHVFRGLLCPTDLSTYSIVRGITGNDPSRLASVNDYALYLGRWYAGLLQCSPSNRASLTGQNNFLTGVSEDYQDAGEKLAECRLKTFPALELLAQAFLWDEVARQESLDAHLNSDDPQMAQWPPLFEAPVLNGDFIVVSLTSTKEVASEFSRLRLGVQSLLSECALGDRHVVALRDRNGTTRTVAQVWISRTEDGWYVAHDIEHRGEDGRYAYQAEVNALENALKQLWGQHHQEKLAQLVDYHGPRRPIVEQKMAAIPYRYDVMAKVLGVVLPASLLSI